MASLLWSDEFTFSSLTDVPSVLDRSRVSTYAVCELGSGQKLIVDTFLDDPVIDF